MPLKPGSQLGTYEILGLLGVGGMGEVYRAKDLRLGREVAMKVLPETVASSPDRLARFEREARTVAGLNHPNIVTLFSVEDEAGIHFLTMELVEGQSLSELIPPGGLPLPRILELAIPLADALTAAHERGVIHRDLKPGNVMVSREGRVKVLDFGLAKLVAPSSSDPMQAPTVAPLSTEGVVVGTVPYMAPEQIRGEAVDARSDLFTLGIILYELTTGRRPFTGETHVDISHAILRDSPEPLLQVRADLPGELDRIVARCLEKDPRERVQTALDVSNELRHLRRDLLQRPGEKPAFDNVASIAVLPFVNRSRDEEDEYFSDGLADELLNMLAKIKGLRVSARASSFHFKGKDVPLAEVGKALKVATVLDGSVRKAGNRVRISVQLVKVADGYHLWSETYDRTLEDIFAVQDDIAQSVVRELRTTLLGEEGDSDASGRVKAEVSKVTKGRGSDPEAHRLYLLARHLLDRDNPGEVLKAIEYLKEALARDPKFALAWAELGAAYSREADHGWAPMAAGYARVREAVVRALQLEPDLAEGYAYQGWMQMTYDWDWRGAQVSYARALELAPGNAMVLRRAGVLAWRLGRLEEGLELHRRALEQDPLSAHTNSNLGGLFQDLDRLEESESAFRRALELAPQKTGTSADLALTLIGQGRLDDALAEAMKVQDEASRLYALAIVHHALGRQAESDAALRRLIENHADTKAFQVAEVHGARSEADSAFEWLDRALAQRGGGLSEVKNSPRLRALHDDPRWTPLLKKVGFEA